MNYLKVVCFIIKSQSKLFVVFCRIVIENTLKCSHLISSSENLVYNQKCQSGFRSLCNKLLYLQGHAKINYLIENSTLHTSPDMGLMATYVQKNSNELNNDSGQLSISIDSLSYSF